jgi:protein TonB
MPFAPLSPPRLPPPDGRLPRAVLRWAFAGSGACLLTLLMLASLGLGARGWQPAALAPALAVLLRAPAPPLPQVSAASQAAQPGRPARLPTAARPTPADTHPAVLAVPAPAPQVTTPVTQAVAPAETQRLGAARTEARPTATQATTTTPPAQPTSNLAERCPTQVAPRFPAAAQADDITEGRVLTRLQLDAAGTVVGVEILSAEPAGYFEREVRHAALKWRCGATGQAETLRVPFHFELK